ncbi:MAG TPA: GNAT family N-acetyltransferase [Caulobacteraceae bacterium]|nr:GNAT family N-acetyltransferase [Caulobacteraceae bacterium]
MAVPAWGSHVIRRPLPGGLEDAAGVYPLAVFAPPGDFEGGLAQLAASGFVSVVMVPDPLLTDASRLAQAFPVFRPYKTHHLIDPAAGPYAPDKHHRYEIRRAWRSCSVDIVPLASHLEEWLGLYAALVDRRAVSGWANFSNAYFQVLAEPGRVTAFRASVDGACAAMSLWFAADGVAYNHLNAAAALGYARGANFALYDAAIAHFAGAGVINLGGGVAAEGANDGLAAFKRGFANASVRSHVCGAILDPARYAALSGSHSDNGYFPAYRAG